MATTLNFTQQSDGTWRASYTSSGTLTLVQVSRLEEAPLYVLASADNGVHNTTYLPPTKLRNQIMAVNIAEGALVTVVSHSEVTYAAYIASELDYYTKSEVDAMLGEVHQFEPVTASTLPTASADTMYKMYFIPKSDTSETGNTSEEWITVRTGTEGSYTYRWEKVGDTEVDLSDYVTETELATTLGGYQQALVSGTNIKTLNGNSLLGAGNLDLNTLPDTTASDNGKILMVVDGEWSAVSVPVADSILY